MKYQKTTMIAAGALAAILGVGSQRAAAQIVLGPIKSWGQNYNGQLGDGNVYESHDPVEVSGIGEVVSVGAGVTHSLAVRPDGTVWGWGDGNFCKVGNGLIVGSYVPIQVMGLSNMVSAAGGDAHSMALKSDGTVWAWGGNYFGQLGNGATVTGCTPAKVPGLSGVIQIAVGANHTLALKSDGTVWAWGLGVDGQIGNGQIADAWTPVRVTGLSGIVSISAGTSHSLALKSNGTVFAWGVNSSGQLGDGTYTNSTVPVQVVGLSNVTSVAAGTSHSVALKSDGMVWSWGANGLAQLGVEFLIPSSNVPVNTLVVTNVKQISAIAYASYAIQADGSVFAWGRNYFGELGNGTYSNSSYLPVRTSVSSGLFLAKGIGSHMLVVVPPPPPTPFATISPALTITSGRNPGFDLSGTFALGAVSNGLNLPAENSTLQIGNYSVIFPIGGFKSSSNGKSSYNGTVNGVTLSAQITPVTSNIYSFKISGTGVNLTTLMNPVTVTLTLGDDAGTSAVTATSK